MNFNSKEGCQKCSITGKYSHVSNTVVFTKIGQPPRTDELFRLRHYVDHQKVVTPLTRLPIDLIKDVVVADPLHLLELGVMKRLLSGWLTGNLGYNTKWSWRQQEEISQLLTTIKMPSEAHRDVRTLKLFKKWKGLEFRNFLNYYCVVVLMHFLPKKYYEHFLKLFCATTICSVEKYLCHLNVADILFKEFICDYKQIYGGEFLTSNVHNLEHVVDDVTRFGTLSTISAYPFENCLSSIKRMMRAGKHPLVQIVNRLTERIFIEDFNFKNCAVSKYQRPIIRNGKNDKCEVELSDFKLSNINFKDMWFNADKKILCMANAFEENLHFFIEGYEVHTYNDLFEKPFKSSLLDIYTANTLNIKNGPLKRVNVCNIACKYVAMQSNENIYAFIPLQHTIKK